MPWVTIHGHHVLLGEKQALAKHKRQRNIGKNRSPGKGVGQAKQRKTLNIPSQFRSAALPKHVKHGFSEFRKQVRFLK